MIMALGDRSGFSATYDPRMPSAARLARRKALSNRNVNPGLCAANHTSSRVAPPRLRLYWLAPAMKS